jgi:hypothetical protein
MAQQRDPNWRNTQTPLPWILGGIIVVLLLAVIAFYNVRGTNTATLPGANSSAATTGSANAPAKSNPSTNSTTR